jgi:hypothetical protein
MKEPFIQVLELASEEGIGKIGNVYRDGGRLKADASMRKALGGQRAGKPRDELKAEIDQLLATAENAGNSSDLDIPVIRIPEGIARRMSGSGRVEGAVGPMKDRDAATEAEREAKQAESDKAAALNGRKAPAGSDRDVIASLPDPKARINLPDTGSRIMPNGKR